MAKIVQDAEPTTENVDKILKDKQGRGMGPKKHALDEKECINLALKEPICDNYSLQ